MLVPFPTYFLKLEKVLAEICNKGNEILLTYEQSVKLYLIVRNFNPLSIDASQQG